MAKKLDIKKSVGDGGDNQPEDVAIVQYLLNLTSERQKVPKKAVPEDGKAGPETIAGIKEYQAKFCKTEVGGKIDPGQETMASFSKTTPVFALNDGTYLAQDRHGKRIA